jgi:NitT/TauT family transport system substrate-binding protein
MNKAGKFLFLLIITALVAVGYLRWGKRGASPAEPTPTAGAQTTTPASPAQTTAAGVPGVEFITAGDRVPDLPPAAPYVVKDGILDVELSEYAGYAGLIAANGGLAPTEDSYLFRKHALKLRIKISESDDWSDLQSGKIAASSTTVDVLPLFGRKLEVSVPALLCFSRGADGVIVRKDIRRINDLKGKVLATAPFNESEFFLRYLAQEASLPVTRLGGIEEKADPNAINVVFCDDAFLAADAFLADLAAGGTALAGCVTWAPKTTEAVEKSGGKAHMLVDNRNLLVVADVLLVNRGLAKANPKVPEALTDAILWGNGQFRDNPRTHLPVLARAMKWTEAQALEELAKVHLANLPENQAFFSGAIDAAGSYEGIYQSAVLAYGPAIVPNPPGAETFHDAAPLAAAAAGGAYAAQTVSIQPIKSGTSGSPIEKDPLLSRDIRFLFQPNSADLDLNKPENHEYLATIKKMLAVSPGSIIVLQGHVDDTNIADFRRQGGEGLVRQMALKAIELSKNRAGTVKKELLKLPGMDPARLETVGRGWEDPKGLTDQDAKRRVEVLWYTVE